MNASNHLLLIAWGGGAVVESKDKAEAALLHLQGKGRCAPERGAPPACSLPFRAGWGRCPSDAQSLHKGQNWALSNSAGQTDVTCLPGREWLSVSQAGSQHRC